MVGSDDYCSHERRPFGCRLFASLASSEFCSTRRLSCLKIADTKGARSFVRRSSHPHIIATERQRASRTNRFWLKHQIPRHPLESVKCILPEEGLPGILGQDSIR